MSTAENPIQTEGIEHLWFDKEVDYDCDKQVQEALVAAGIGENECPTIGEWAAFAVAGGIVKHLTGRQIEIPPRFTPEGYRNNTEKSTWQELWQATEQQGSVLDRRLLAAILKLFLPRRHDPDGPSDPYSESYFVARWDWMNYSDAFLSSIGNVRLKRLKEGREALSQLPPEVASQIQEIAAHIPPVLDLAVRHVRATHHW